MGHVGARPARPAVPADAERTRAAGGRNGSVAPVLRGRLEAAPRQMKRQLRSWLWHIPVEQEVDEELGFHVDMRTRALIESGMDPGLAREAALRRLGDVRRLRRTSVDLGRKRDREMRLTQWLEESGSDVR